MIAVVRRCCFPCPNIKPTHSSKTTWYLLLLYAVILLHEKTTTASFVPKPSFVLPWGGASVKEAGVDDDLDVNTAREGTEDESDFERKNELLDKNQRRPEIREDDDQEPDEADGEDEDDSEEGSDDEDVEVIASVENSENAVASDEISTEQADDERKKSEDVSASAGNDQRGGALLKAAKPRRFQWLSPLDTEKVAPLASRLLSDDDDEGKRGKPIAGAHEEVTIEVSESSTQYVEGDSKGSIVALTEQKDTVIEIESESLNGNDSSVPSSLDSGADTGDQVLEKSSSFESSSPFESSGIWGPVDALLTLGLSSRFRGLRLSRRLRTTRKLAAKLTGLHGALSGKKSDRSIAELEPITEDQQLGSIRRRLAAIERAKERIPHETVRRGLWGRQAPTEQDEYDLAMRRSAKEKMLEKRKMERVKEIDRLFIEGQKRLFELLCEKDMLQRRPNPLWNYTTVEVEVSEGADSNSTGTSIITATRRFNFPPPDMVDEYLEMIFLSSRLVKMNHTDLWRNDGEDYDDDDEQLDDFIDFTRRRKNVNEKSSGTWWLRHGLGQKIGETVETAAYKSVCTALMSVLARSISSIHGLTVMTYSDIRLSMDQAPALPPLSAGMIPGSNRDSNYAKKAIQDVIHRGARKNRKKRQNRRRLPSDEDFVQREAVVETLLSHCQISMPLLQLFPLVWQRALLSNIIVLTTIVISDFFEGLEFHILGHRLSFLFTPITEDDMLRGITSEGFNRKRPDQDEFEAAVRATAAQLSQELKFLDKWHERALGSDMLRAQISNLIARLVLVLVDDLLRGARMDLWATHAGGPRLVSNLEFRTGANYIGDTAPTSATR